MFGDEHLRGTIPRHQQDSLPRSVHKVTARLEITFLVRETYHPYPLQVKCLCWIRPIAYLLS